MRVHASFPALVSGILLFALPYGAQAYSVLTHQAIIDSAWKESVEPALLRRFPGATPGQLQDAQAYAYGGCIIQDMGYYPFGSKLFSDLVHYVRAGDFVTALLREARTLDEYAFALGALAHYAADNYGHPLGVNRSVPLSYPKLRREYGDVVTYAQDRPAHIKTEFGFDVLQVARGNYASKAYHDFIGFQVAKPVLERAFEATYCMKLEDVFTSVDLALGTYRRTVSTIIPTATRVAWEMKEDEIVKASPGMTRQKFLYNISRASYEKEWGREYRRPGMGARILAVVFRIVPKIGPFKALSFRPPTQQTAQLFMESFNRTLDAYRSLLAHAAAGGLHLPNLDFDTGQRAHAGEYRLADESYAAVLDRLSKRDFRGVSPDLRAAILAFYDGFSAPADTKKKEGQWRKTMLALEKLKALEPPGSPSVAAAQ